MDKLTHEIISYLLKESFSTSSHMAELFNVSEKTIRNRIKEIEEELTKNGGLIVSRRGLGYSINIIDKELFDAWFYKDRTNSLPVLPQERILYIVKLLLLADDYILIEDLSKEIYVSRNTISADIKQVSLLLKKYGLKIIHKPYYGIRIEPNELNIRTCLSSLYDKNLFDNYDDVYNNCRKIIRNVFIRNCVAASIERYQEIASYLAVTYFRMMNNHYLVFNQERRDTLEKYLNNLFEIVGEQVKNEFENDFKLEMSKDEIMGICYKIAALTNLNAYGNQISFDGEIDKLGYEMLEEVKKVLKIDLTNNWELRASLNRHLYPLMLRLIFGVQVENPAIEMIKRKYSYAYSVAACASTVLLKKFRCTISADEIAFIAVIMAIALDKSKRRIKKKNIIIVCLSGQNTSKLFVYMYKKTFGDYLGDVYQCAVQDLNNFDYEGKSIDYCFTTIDSLDIQIPVPLFYISLFPDENEIEKYRRILSTESINNLLENYLDEDLFISDLSCKSKEEAIDKMIYVISKKYLLPANFKNLIMERESYGLTTFGTRVAMPHPGKVCTKENIICIAVLSEAMTWNVDDINVIILTSFSENMEDDSSIFIEAISNFVCDDEKISELIKKPTFNNFVKILGS